MTPPSLLQISYQDGREILREGLVVCTQLDFAVSRLQVDRPALPADHAAAAGGGPLGARRFAEY